MSTERSGPKGLLWRSPPTIGQEGMTLVELIVFIVILGVAIAGVLAIFINTTRNSADPLVRKQALAVAESLLEEIASVPISCPIGATCLPVTPTNRQQPHQLMNYNGFAMSGISRLDGSPIGALGDYSAAVQVQSASLNGENGFLVTVTVTHPSGISVVLNGWRGNF